MSALILAGMDLLTVPPLLRLLVAVRSVRAKSKPTKRAKKTNKFLYICPAAEGRGAFDIV